MGNSLCKNRADSMGNTKNTMERVLERCTKVNNVIVMVKHCKKKYFSRCCPIEKRSRVLVGQSMCKSRNIVCFDMCFSRSKHKSTSYHVMLLNKLTHCYDQHILLAYVNIFDTLNGLNRIIIFSTDLRRVHH